MKKEAWLGYNSDNDKKVLCADCGNEVLKGYACYDSESGEWVCEEHLDDKTGYCSISCQRGQGCDGTC